MNEEKARVHIFGYADKIVVTPAFSAEYDMREYSAFVPGQASIIICVRDNYGQRGQAESVLAQFLVDHECTKREDVEVYNCSVLGRDDKKDTYSSSLEDSVENLRNSIKRIVVEREKGK